MGRGKSTKRAGPPLFISHPVRDGELRDGALKSRPIKRGRRVYVPAHEHPVLGTVPAKAGKVTNIYRDHQNRPVVVFARKDGGYGCARPEQCRVQY
jgi:hypothetical protein